MGMGANGGGWFGVENDVVVVVGAAIQDCRDSYGHKTDSRARWAGFRPKTQNRLPGLDYGRNVTPRNGFELVHGFFYEFRKTSVFKYQPLSFVFPKSTNKSFRAFPHQVTSYSHKVTLVKNSELHDQISVLR